MNKNRATHVTREKLAEKLFQELNRELKVWEPSIGNAIRCPICWQRFERDSLQSNALSKEHVPPKKVAKLIGEKHLITLTCSQCNNKVGTRYQSDLKRFLINQLHIHGKYGNPIPGTVVLQKTPPLRSNITWTPGSVLINGVPRANNPKDVQAQIDILDRLVEQKGTDWEFTAELNYGYKLPAARLAYLHAAYLMAVIYTKYRYGYTKAGEQLRKLLADNAGNTQNVLQACLIEPLKIGIGGKPWLAQITDPIELRCLWVKIAGNIIILPVPSDEGLACYEAWQRASSNTHFGMQPRRLSFRASFLSKEDAQEAASCLPGVFPDIA